MKNLLLGLCFVSTLAVAEPFQSQKPIVCATTEEVFHAMQERYEEKPIMLSKDLKSNTQYMILINIKKDSWTLVQFNNETACIIATGNQIKLMLENLGEGI